MNKLDLGMMLGRLETKVNTLNDPSKKPHYADHVNDVLQEMFSVLITVVDVLLEKNNNGVTTTL